MKHSTMTNFEIERALDLASPLPEGEQVICWIHLTGKVLHCAFSISKH